MWYAVREGLTNILVTALDNLFCKPYKINGHCVTDTANVGSKVQKNNVHGRYDVL